MVKVDQRIRYFGSRQILALWIDVLTRYDTFTIAGQVETNKLLSEE